MMSAMSSKEHFLKLASDGIDNVTDMAAALGCTTGAASKIKTKLQQSGVLKAGIKIKINRNNNHIYSITTYLYRYFDKENRLLYVGISKNVVVRLTQHEQHSHWFDLISQITITKFPNRKDAELAEQIAIIEERPLFNIKGGCINCRQKLATILNNGIAA